MSTRKKRERGQVLVIFAGGLFGLIALMALAIDISMVYSLQQTERSLADAASLAGAQDLQSSTSRTVPAGGYTRARQHALESVAGALGVAPPSCNPAVNVIDCSIPPYLVSVKTNPSPSYVNVDPYRAVQVTVRNPSVPLTFARLFGQGDWNVGITSVAGLGYGKSYAIITLRPPKENGATFDVNDIELNGSSTTINVIRGDVGTNSNMRYTVSGATMNIDPGYGIYYFDPTGGPAWVGQPMLPSRTVAKLTTLIRDPGYRYPVMTGAQEFNDVRTSQVVSGTSPAELGVERADLNPACLALANRVPSTYSSFMPSPVTVANGGNIYCYKPGTYRSLTGALRAQIVVGAGQIALLYPGVYYLRSGLDVGSYLIGGFEPGQQGVALMFDQSGPSNCSGCIFEGTNADAIALNAGTKFQSTGGQAATPALDRAGVRVDTGTLGPTPPLIMTVLVRHDTNGTGGTQGCFVPTSPPYIEPSACDASQNKTIKIAGGGQLALEGVQYAPTDNVAISGNSDGKSTVGQFIAWTITYSGNSTLNQEGPSSERAGIIHLDAACSGGGNLCNP